MAIHGQRIRKLFAEVGAEKGGVNTSQTKSVRRTDSDIQERLASSKVFNSEQISEPFFFTLSG